MAKHGLWKHKIFTVWMNMRARCYNKKSKYYKDCGGRGISVCDEWPVRIPSSSKNGMQDIDANLKHPEHPYGIPWKIEIKFGDDVHADHQKDYGKIVQQTGGVYSVVRSMEDLYSQYDRLMVTQKELFS